MRFIRWLHDITVVAVQEFYNKPVFIKSIVINSTQDAQRIINGNITTTKLVTSHILIR